MNGCNGEPAFWPSYSEAHVNISLQLVNLGKSVINISLNTIAAWKLTVLTCPLIWGSPFKYHSGWGRIASPNTSFSCRSAFNARTMLRKTELDSFSWFLANVMNAVQPVMPNTTTATAVGHLDYQNKEWVVRNLQTGFMECKEAYPFPRQISEWRVLGIVRPRFCGIWEGLNDRLASRRSSW